MNTYQRVCGCCGVSFVAGHSAAKWCSSRCSMRAYQRRRRGAPEADASAVLQPMILADYTDLPYPWNPNAAPAGTDQREWNGTAIQRRQSDGFVNATAMCQAGGKLFADYSRLARTQEYITALADAVGPQTHCGAAVAGNPITANKGSMGNPITGYGLIHTVQGGTPSLQGTWIHPRLAVDLARWISPAFAVWMDGWFLESLTRPEHSAPAQPTLAPGVHVVADNYRDAHRLWAGALKSELLALVNMAHQDLFGTTDLPVPRFHYHVGT